MKTSPQLTFAFRDSYAPLLAKGYCVLPIKAGSKAPAIERWTDRPKPTKVQAELWSQSPFGIGVRLGPISGGVINLDLDRDDPEFIAAIYAAGIPKSSVVKVGRRGHGAFFYAPGVTKSVKWKGYAEILSDGAQVVLPPSIHPDTGLPYSYQNGHTLADFWPVDLTPWPSDGEAIVDAVCRRFGFEGEVGVPKCLVNETFEADADLGPHAELNARALAQLDRWVPALQLYRCQRTRHGFAAVATWRPSTTGRPNEVRKLNLGISRRGIKDFGTGETYSAIDLVMAARGCDLAEAFEWLDEQVNGPAIEIGLKVPEVVEEPVDTTPAADADDFPEALTYPGGLVEAIIDWIVASSRRPSRPLALGAALALVGHVASRQILGPTRSGTFLYLVGLALSAGGKGTPLNALTSALMDVEARGKKRGSARGRFMGPQSFMSGSAVCHAIQREAQLLCPMNEIGASMRCMFNRNTSTHEQRISQFYRDLWDRSDSHQVLPEWANREKQEPIYAPAVTVFGTSTPSDFWGAFGSDEITNGFLNRWTAISTTKKTPRRQPTANTNNVPTEIVHGLAEIFYLGTGEEPLSRSNKLDKFPHIVVPWRDAEAEKTFAEFEAEVEALAEANDGELDPYYGRTAEQAIRIATIVALGRDKLKAQVTVADVKYGKAVALASARSMIAGCGRYIAENENQRQYKLVRGIIETAKRITRRALTERLDGTMKAREIKDQVEALKDAGKVKVEAGKAGAKGGRPPEAYVWIGCGFFPLFLPVWGFFPRMCKRIVAGGWGRNPKRGRNLPTPT